MAAPVSVVLVGIGGYGEMYLSALLDYPSPTACRLVGAVDPDPDRCTRLADLEQRSVPVFDRLEAFYGAHDAELAIISSPIQLHADHTCEALTHGSRVLVEKPAAAVPPDVDRMIAVRDATDGFVAVGFQWSFADSILALKRDILAGRFGGPHGGRCLTLWARPESYYRRNEWAGRRRDAHGRWILDSPVCNAMAHDLHNLLFLLGPRMDRSAEPAAITAMLARANDIETFDSIAGRIVVHGGHELLCLASHAVSESEEIQPRFVLEFDDAVVRFPGEQASITAACSDGSTVTYASPNTTPQETKLWQCVEAVHGQAPIHCGLEAARPHTACVNGIEVAGIPVQEFRQEHIHRSDTASGPLRWVAGLADSFVQSYETGDWPEVLA
jgi:predicted dehydrogenase